MSFREKVQVVLQEFSFALSVILNLIILFAEYFILVEILNFFLVFRQKFEEFRIER
jgi:hypothetical protein